MSYVRSLFTLLLLVLGTLTGTLGCEDGSGGQAPIGAHVESISLTPPTLSIAAGTTGDIRAIVVFSNQATADVTAAAMWTSSDPNVATVSAGKVKGLKPGNVVITATGEGQSRTAVVNVTAALLTSLSVTPPSPSVPKGLKQQLTATGTFGDGTTQDLTKQVIWSSSAPATGTVDAGGLVSALALGPTTITATMGTVSGNTVVTVASAGLVSIEVTPDDTTVPMGVTKQMTATGIFTDATKVNITGQAAWASTVPATASVDQTGLVFAKVTGTVSISATVMGIVGTTNLSVSNATLVSVGVTPAAPSVAKGLTQQFTATGVFSDTTTQDLTTQATWASTDTAVSQISNAAGSNGKASALTLGTTTISAAFGGKSGSTTLTVTNATLQSIGITPAGGSMPKGLPQQFIATGVFSDATMQNLTNVVTWESSDTNKVTISNAAGSNGLAATPAVGTVTIKATSGAISGSTNFTVTAAALVSIQVTPINTSKAKGLPQQFIAMGTYTDMTAQDLTSTVVWSSNDTNKVTISNAAGSNGLAATPGLGGVTITATSGAISGNTPFTVTAATIVSLAVSPLNPSKAKGLTQPFTATGTFTDNSMVDVTTSVVWESSNLTTATISNAALSQGQAKALAVGTTTIKATTGALSASTTFTVTPAVLATITVTPATPSIPLGLNQEFVATGNYTDGATQDLTATVVWASSDVTKATIDIGPPKPGRAKTKAVGTTTISATTGGITGTTLLTVIAPALTSITVTPANPTVPKGSPQQFTATGNYTNGSTQPLTGVVLWESSDTTVAQISNAAGSIGQATTLKIGTTTIMATYMGIVGQTVLTVDKAALVSLAITPVTLTLDTDEQQQYVATATFTDGPQIVTGTAVWASSDPLVGYLDPIKLGPGVVLAERAGTSVITATFGGLTSNDGNLTVVDPPRYVFVSSALYNGGNMGGVAGADQKCSTLATAGGLRGKYKAWISDDTNSPSTTFIASSKPYVLVDGTKVADHWSHLTNTQQGFPLSSAINKDEKGLAGPVSQIDVGDGGGNLVHTNTLASGGSYSALFGAQADLSCSNWTSTAGTSLVGDNLLTDGYWTEKYAFGGTCSQSGPIYCFRQVREFGGR